MFPELLTHCNLMTQTWNGWVISTLYQQGLGHQSLKKPSEDAVLVQPVGDHLLLAVADGVSTVPFGRQGAHLAVHALHTHIRDQLDKPAPFPHKDILAHAMGNAHLTLQAEANRDHHDIMEYSCTLACVLIGPTAILAANIGDSSIAQLTTVKSSRTPGQPVLVPMCSSEQPDDRVHPITRPTWKDHLQHTTHHREGIDALLLLSDGADNFLLDGNTPPLSPFTTDTILGYLDAFGEYTPRQLPIWLASYILDRESQNADDRTLIIATPPRADAS